MPIVVIRGHEHNVKKKLQQVATHGYQAAVRLNSQEDSDEESDETKKKNKEKILHDAFDMEDVVNLKVYRVSKPHFVDGSVKTSLVGDVYYTGEGEQGNQVITNETEKIQQVKEEKATLLQKIRAFRSQHSVKSKSEGKSFLAGIKEDEKRCKMIKAGQSLGKHVKLPTSDEVLHWAIKYVNTNEHALVAVFLELAAKMKTFDPSNTAIKQENEGGKKSPTARFRSSLSANHAGKTLGGTNQGGGDSPIKNSVSLSKSAQLAQQLENIKTQGQEHFIRNVTLDIIRQKKSSRQSTSRQNNSAQSSRDASMVQGGESGHIAGGPQRPNQGKRSNASPRARVPARSPHAMASQIPTLTPTTLSPAQSVHQDLPQSMGPSMAIDEECVDVDVTGVSGGVIQDGHEVGGLGMAGVMNLPPPLTIPPQSGSVDVDHVLAEIPEGDGEDPAEEEESGENKSPRAPPGSSQTPQEPAPAIKPNPPKHKHRKVVQIADKGKKKDDGANLETSRENGDDGDDGKRAAEPTSSPSSPSRPTKPKPNLKVKLPPKMKATTTKYSSAKTAEPGENEGVLAYEQLRRTQAMFMQQMGYTLDIFKKTTEKYEQLHKIAQKKLRRIDRHGNTMLQQCEDYTEMEALSAEVAHQLWVEKQYHRMNVMSVKMQYFKVDGDLGHVGSSAAEELRKVREMAEEAEEKAQIKCLVEVKWFSLATVKLRDSMRRMNNSVPPCTLKMLIVLKYLIVLGFKVSVDMFYFILLSSIFQEEDFRKNIVNQIIEVVRIGLEIKPEDFLAFLEANKIQPHPELLNEIRMMAAQLKSPQPGNVKFKFPPTPSGLPKSPMYADQAEERPMSQVSAPTSPLAVVAESHVAFTEIPLLELPTIENVPKDGILASDT